jgi:DNA-binding transcriptional MerR regulator
MDPSVVIDEDATYSVSELAGIFDVSRHSIHNWCRSNKLSCDRDTNDNRVFYGSQVIGDIKGSNLLMKRIREAQDLEVQDQTYSTKLENKVFELEDRIDRLEEEKDQLRQEKMDMQKQYEQIIELLRDQIDEKDHQIDRLLDKGDTQPAIESPDEKNEKLGDRVLEQARRLPVLGNFI